MLKPMFQTNPGLWAILPVRLGLGAIFMAHGAQKVFGWWDGPGLAKMAEMFGQMGFTPGILWASLASYGEFLGGLLLLAGLFTRFGALNILIIMLVAMFKVHWGQFFLPNGIEYTVALSMMAITMLIAGGGPLSLDTWMMQKGCCSHHHEETPSHV